MEWLALELAERDRAEHPLLGLVARDRAEHPLREPAEHVLVEHPPLVQVELLLVPPVEAELVPLVAAPDLLVEAAMPRRPRMRPRPDMPEAAEAELITSKLNRDGHPVAVPA